MMSLLNSYLVAVKACFSRWQGGGITQCRWVRKLYGGSWILLEITSKHLYWVDARIFEKKGVAERFFNVTKRESYRG